MEAKRFAQAVEQDVVYQCSLYIYSVANTITRCARPKPYLEWLTLRKSIRGEER